MVSRVGVIILLSGVCCNVYCMDDIVGELAAFDSILTPSAVVSPVSRTIPPIIVERPAPLDCYIKGSLELLGSYLARCIAYDRAHGLCLLSDSECIRRELSKYVGFLVRGDVQEDWRRHVPLDILQACFFEALFQLLERPEALATDFEWLVGSVGNKLGIALAQDDLSMLLSYAKSVGHNGGIEFFASAMMSRVCARYALSRPQSPVTVVGSPTGVEPMWGGASRPIAIPSVSPVAGCGSDGSVGPLSHQSLRYGSPSPLPPAYRQSLLICLGDARRRGDRARMNALEWQLGMLSPEERAQLESDSLTPEIIS